MPDLPAGLLVLDKPTGPTSFDCVRMARRALGVQRVGHCGTLDPLAQGVLLVLYGSSTRRQEEFLGLEKQYWFRAEFGRHTDSGDLAGKVLQENAFDGVTRERLESVTPEFQGEILQVPPAVSALKYKGRRGYEWARRGIDVPRTARPIRIHSFTILACEGRFWEARVVCSRGTYIRSLVQDVANRLGTIGTLVSLVRERIGSYTREAALSWDHLRTIKQEELLTYGDTTLRAHAGNL